MKVFVVAYCDISQLWDLIEGATHRLLTDKREILTMVDEGDTVWLSGMMEG